MYGTVPLRLHEDLPGSWFAPRGRANEPTGSRPGGSSWGLPVTPPESGMHLFLKARIARDLAEHPGVMRAQAEVILPDGQRPDVLFRTQRGQLVAVEIQRSDISNEELAERTRLFSDKRCAVLWVVGDAPPENDEEFTPRKWQRFLHGLYYGRVFYPALPDRVVEVRFRKVERFKDYGYNHYGEEVGGYRYTLKRRKIADHVRDLDVVSGFRAQWRKPWKHIPGALLWVPCGR